jgi:hypothetical protein
MPRFLILTQSDVTARALNAWLELLGEKELEDTNAGCIVWDRALDGLGTIQAYNAIVDQIELAIEASSATARPAEWVALVDAARPDSLSAISEAGWDAVVAMLVLTYPEIRWAFGLALGVDPGRAEAFLNEHGLCALLARPWRDPLFDPTGLREWIRSRTNAKLEEQRGPLGTKAFQVPRRDCVAASIEDEPEAAAMNACAAYRYGFRADLITSWTSMRDRFSSGPADAQSARSQGHGYELLLEDMRLMFPDKPATVHLTRLGDRGAPGACPLLSNAMDTSRWRFVITTGQMAHDGDEVRANEDYLREKVRGRGALHMKPMGGLCDMWETLGLADDLEGGSRSGNGEGFVWPPTEEHRELDAGHASPGKLALVAETLLRRALAARDGARTASEFVRAAVMATDAAELLGGKTPTTTLAAIALKHECEVRAECTFVGAGFHFGLGRRLKELTEEIEAVGRWFHSDTRHRATLDARATVVNRLVMAFRDAGQLEEEELCLVELRGLNRRMNRPSTPNPVAWFSHGVLAYGEWLLGSFGRLVVMTLLWLLAFVAVEHSLASRQPTETATTVVRWFFGGEPGPAEPSQPPAAAADALSAAGTTTGWPVDQVEHAVSWLGVVVGVFHVGVLISYLYSLISRK